MLIYHIVLPEVWAKFSDATEYEADSLAAEGFIHCSYRNQLDGVLERYYRGVARVMLLNINASRLTSPLIAEPSTNGEVYPHIYGKINKSAIVDVEEKWLT